MILLNPFKSVEPNPVRLADAAKKPYPDIRYAIHFTPRSGSSRLTDICKNSSQLGKPGEVFQKPGKAGLVVLGIGPVRQLQFTKPRRVAHGFVKTQLVQPQLGFEELLGLGVGGL